jgi:hypothetical protein
VADYGDLSEFAKTVWGKRAQGLPVPELDLKRAISTQEIDNILLRYAFAQIINPEAVGEEFNEIRFIRSRSGWLILHYGNAMTTSPGNNLFDHGTYITAEDGSLERVCSGTGTINMKIINAAEDMIGIAKEEGWPVIHIVNGHPLMSWGIWKAAKELNLLVTGYVPSKDEEVKFERIQRLCSKTLVIQPKTPTAGR